MRTGIGVLSVLLLLLQVRLWVSDDGYREVARLGALITGQTAENARLAQRNQRLEAEVVELRKGDTAVEERARADLGLIGPDETFYLFGGARPAG
ncbi:MAG: septum formation initiator family protein [Chromatiales bacterium]|nr:septum formation initiator family protein [Chromatiales bacterium]